MSDQDEYLAKHPLPVGLRHQLEDYEWRLLTSKYEKCFMCGQSEVGIYVTNDPISGLAFCCSKCKIYYY